MDSNKITVVEAVLPIEIKLYSTTAGSCNGDGCNSDQGGCTHDAGCGQHC